MCHIFCLRSNGSEALERNTPLIQRPTSSLKKHTIRVLPIKRLTRARTKHTIRVLLIQRLTYQRSFSPGSIYQPGLKMKSCPDLLAINTKHDRGGDEEQEYGNSGEEASQTSPEGKDRIQIIRIRLHTSNSAFYMQALTSHCWAVCR